MTTPKPEEALEGGSPWHAPAVAPRRSLRERLRRRTGGYQGVEIARHKARLPDEAGLHVLLDSQAYAEALQAYEWANARAVKKQNIYKRSGLIALLLATLATLAAALTLLPFTDLFPGYATRVVSGLQVFANIVSLGIVWWLNRTGAVDEWMSARAEAERLRGRLFADILASPPPPGASSAQIWSEKLGLLRAAHVDHQRGYFESAARRHAERSKSLSLPRGIAVGAIGLAVIIAGVTALDWWPRDLVDVVPWLRLAEEPIRWQLGLNTIASSLLAFASAHAMINQDERNAALYRHSAARLDGLNAEAWSGAVAAAAAGDGETVMAYARRVQDILEADHQAWQLNRPPPDPTCVPPARLKL